MSLHGTSAGRRVGIGTLRLAVADDPVVMAVLAVVVEATLVVSWLLLWPTEAPDLSVPAWAMLLFAMPGTALALSVAALRGWGQGRARTAAAGVGAVTGLVAWTWVALAVAYLIWTC